MTRERWKEHTNTNNGCVAIKRAILKYGFDNFEKSVIMLCMGNQDDLNKLEIELIIKHNSLAPNGYNLRTGGANGKISEITRMRMRESQLEKHVGEKNHFYGKKHTENSLVKMSNAKIGKLPPNKGVPMSIDTRKLMSILKKGKPFLNKRTPMTQEQKDKRNAKRLPVTPETKAKMSLAHTGKILTPTHKLNISKGLKGRLFSIETRQKISLSKIGIKASVETKIKLSIANKGKILSAETKFKMSQAKLGKLKSDETKAKMSASRIGHVNSEETRRRISESNKSKIPWNKDLKMPKAQVDSMSKKVNQLSLEGVLIKQWLSQSEASRELKLSVGNISMACRGLRNMTGGFLWKHAD